MVSLRLTIGLKEVCPAIVKTLKLLILHFKFCRSPDLSNKTMSKGGYDIRNRGACSHVREDKKTEKQLSNQRFLFINIFSMSGVNDINGKNFIKDIIDDSVITYADTVTIPAF